MDILDHGLVHFLNRVLNSKKGRASAQIVCTTAGRRFRAKVIRMPAISAARTSFALAPMIELAGLAEGFGFIDFCAEFDSRLKNSAAAPSQSSWTA